MSDESMIFIGIIIITGELLWKMYRVCVEQMGTDYLTFFRWLKTRRYWGIFRRERYIIRVEDE